MVDRTEEQVVTKASIEVILGGKKYEIAPLVIRDSRVWRKKFIDLVVPLPSLLNTIVDASNPEGFGSVLSQMMIAMPDQVIDLFFEYAKDLNREDIEAIATDTEISKAFEEVVKVTFPLTESLPKALARLSR